MLKNYLIWTWLRFLGPAKTAETRDELEFIKNIRFYDVNFQRLAEKKVNHEWLLANVLSSIASNFIISTELNGYKSSSSLSVLGHLFAPWHILTSAHNYRTNIWRQRAQLFYNRKKRKKLHSRGRRSDDIITLAIYVWKQQNFCSRFSTKRNLMGIFSVICYSLPTHFIKIISISIWKLPFYDA